MDWFKCFNGELLEEQNHRSSNWERGWKKEEKKETT